MGNGALRKHKFHYKEDKVEREEGVASDFIKEIWNKYKDPRESYVKHGGNKGVKGCKIKVSYKKKKGAMAIIDQEPF